MSAPEQRQDKMAEVLNSFNKRKAKEERFKKRQEALKNSPAYYIDLAEKCIVAIPTLNWPDIQNWQPTTGALEDWQNFVSIADEDLINKFRLAGSAKITGYPTMPIRWLKSEHIQKLVSIEGKVIGIGEIEPFPLVARFRCDKCGQLTDSKNGLIPWYCSTKEKGNDGKDHNCKGMLRMDADHSVFVNSQLIKVQELANENGRQLSIFCRILDDEFHWATRPGQTVRITGIFKVHPVRDAAKGAMKFLKSIDIANIERLEDDVKLESSDVEWIKKLPEEPQFYEKFRDSYAAFLYGLEEPKEACMLALASQGLERPLNIMLIGDPDTGKSEMMWFAVDLSHNGHKTDMASTTKVGLTVESAVDPDTKVRIATPGLLHFADGGLAGIDEFQAIDEKDTKALNGVLEGKKVLHAKAGGEGELQARCAIIISSNSAQGRYDPELNLYENLLFLKASTAAIVSRFDLIYILRDLKNIETDEKKANKIVKTYGKTEIPKELIMDDYTDPDTGVQYFGFKTMKKYLMYIAKQPLPEVPDALIPSFVGTYMMARKSDKDNMVGNRYFKSIIRLARIIARFMQKQAVTVEDLTAAKALIDKSRDAAAFDPKVQKADPNALFGSIPQSQIQENAAKTKMNKTEQFWKCYDLAYQKEKGYAEESAWRTHLKVDHGWTNEEFDKWIKDAETAGKIMIGTNGRGNWTRVEQS